MGVGAIVAVLFCRGCASLDATSSCWRHLLQAGATAVMAWRRAPGSRRRRCSSRGMAWITVANSLTVSAQLALPDWVRARGMSIYQMAIMGASALGAALWGQVATARHHTSLGIVASTGGTCAWGLARARRD